MNEYLMRNWIKSTQNAYKKPHPFNSSSERIIKNTSFSNPGPGAYNPPVKDIQRTSKYRVVQEKKSPIEQQFQWMFSRERESGLTLKDNNILLGPGAYNVNQSHKSFKNSWSKASRFKATPQSVKSDSPGPGFYESQKNEHRPAAQFVFKSKLKKQLELIKQRPALPPQQDEKLRDPDIQTDNVESQIKETKRSAQKSSVFASKVPRFLTQSGINYVGPGSYDLESSGRSRLKTELPRMVRFKPSKAPMFRSKASSQIGPGSYNINKYALSRELQFKGYPISKQTRFNFSGKKNQSTILPGPGSYMQNKYVYINEAQLLKRKMNKKYKQSVQMWARQSSDAQKASNLQIRQSSGPGQYNINAHDIEFRMRKKLEHAQKLKLMEISVPPFNSKVPRLLP